MHTKDDITAARVRLNFDEKYGPGASDKFIAAVAQGLTQRQASDDYGVSQARIGIIYAKMTGRKWSDRNVSA